MDFSVIGAYGAGVDSNRNCNIRGKKIVVGFLSSMARAGNPAVENRYTVNPVHPRDPVLAQMFGDPGGVSVTPESAMRVTAVYACVSLIAETLAALPLHVYRSVDTDDADKIKGNRGVVKARKKFPEHPLYPILHDMPLPGMTAFEWREMQISHTALSGDSYARIITNNRGQITELPPILPRHIEPFRGSSGRVQYRWWENGIGAVKILFDDEVLRVPHKMMDGVNSLSPIGTHKMTIGNALSANTYLRSFYQNSAQPKGALLTPELLNDTAAKALRESWEERHKGPQNAGRIAIFDGGMKFEQIGMNMDDAQYLELQGFSVADIARIFLVPPHKIGELTNATFSNIEHQAIEFVVDTILRWVRRIEMRYNNYLLSSADRRAGVYIAFDLKGLLRGDASARANFYKALFYIGAMSPNEIRAAEEMNPYKGGEGYFVQGATVPIGEAAANAGTVNSADSSIVEDQINDAIAAAMRKFEQERN